MGPTSSVRVPSFWQGLSSPIVTRLELRLPQRQGECNDTFHPILGTDGTSSSLAS